MSGLCPHCKRPKTKLLKFRTNDYDPNNRKLGDVYFVEKKVNFCCLTKLMIDLYESLYNKISKIFTKFR